jgi:hypothetical protein
MHSLSSFVLPSARSVGRSVFCTKKEGGGRPLAGRGQAHTLARTLSLPVYAIAPMFEAMRDRSGAGAAVFGAAAVGGDDSGAVGKSGAVPATEAGGFSPSACTNGDQQHTRSTDQHSSGTAISGQRGCVREFHTSYVIPSAQWMGLSPSCPMSVSPASP